MLERNNEVIVVLPRSLFFEKTVKYSCNMSKKDLYLWLSHQFTDLPYESEDLVYAYNVSESEKEESKEQSCIIYAALKENIKKKSISEHGDLIIFDKYLPVQFILPIYELDENMLHLFLYADELMIFSVFNNNIKNSRSLNVSYKNRSEINQFINESREYFTNHDKHDFDISNTLHYYASELDKYPVFQEMSIKKVEYDPQIINEQNFLNIDEISDYLNKQNSIYSFLRTLIISFILLFLIYACMQYKLQRLREKLNNYEQQISELDNEHQQNLKDFNIRNYIYKSEMSGKLLLNAIDKIYTYLPEGTFVHQFTIRKNGDFYIRGITKDTVVNFVQDLEKTIYFSNVSIRYLSRKEKKKEIDFQITGIIPSWENKL